MPRPRPSPLRTWLQLLRAPNLFTVPGDPVAGYLLASFGALEPELLWAVLASVCFYCAGLLLNDLADLAEDRAERPGRPLPSGAAGAGAVRAAMLLFFATALGLCARLGPWAFGVGAALTAAIAAYNLRSKRIAVLGPLNMGLCRGLSLLLGSVAVPHGDLTLPLLLHGRLNHLGAAFATVTLFIAAITQLARHETREETPGLAKWLPAAALGTGLMAFLPLLGGPSRTPFTALSLLALFASLHAASELLARPAPPLPPIIGKLIRLLLPLQASYAAATGEPFGAAIASAILLLWPLSRIAGRFFYAS